MPFARVGAMPQTMRSDGGQAGRGARQSRVNRERGITMEDLKKQTAIRLAQEQQQGQAAPLPPTGAMTAASDPRTRHPVVTPQTLAARRLATATTQPANREAAPMHFERHGHNPIVHHIPNTIDSPPAVSTAFAAPVYYDQPPQGGRHSRKKSGRQVNKASNVSVASPHTSSTGIGGTLLLNQHSMYLRSLSAPSIPSNPPLATNASGYNTASSIQGGQSSSTSKLPHGLTVHELKEMTKARLQAEAAEKMSSFPPSTSPTEIESRKAIGFESMQPNYGQQKLYTREFDPMNQGVDAHQASINLGNLEQNSQIGRQPVQVSPVPPAFQHYGTASFSFDGNGSIDPRVVPVGNRNRVDSFPENWESASVTSHNSTVASDYLGSESAFSSGVGCFSQLDEPPCMSLGRTQSYPIGNSRPGVNDLPSRDRETTQNSLPSPLVSSYYESSSLGPGRQRAMTLSPRPGLSLLHEDRPGFCDEDLGIPSFSSSRHGHQQLTARSRRSFSPVLHHQSFVEPTYAFGCNAPGVIGGSLLDNRPRTSSAASLPAISHTAEEFVLDNGAAGRRSSDSVSIRGHAPSSSIGGSDAFLIASSLYSSTDSIQQRSSSVFQNEFGCIPAPPGLGRPSKGEIMDGGLGSIGNRVRAATWVAGSMSGSNMFGSGNCLYEYSGEDTLAGDLASILKLSGAEEKSDATGRSVAMFNNDVSGFL